MLRYIICFLVAFNFTSLNAQISFTNDQILKIANRIDSLEKENQKLIELNAINDTLLVKYVEKDSLHIASKKQLLIKNALMQEQNNLLNNSLNQCVEQLQRKKKWWETSKFWFPAGVIVGLILPNIL